MKSVFINVCKKDIFDNAYWVLPNTENHSRSHIDLGILHREDGPAIEWHDGDIYWYFFGRKIKPTLKMIKKYIKSNPDNILKDYYYPLEIQKLAIKLKPSVIFNIKYPHKKLKKYYSKLYTLKDSGLI